MQKYIKENKEKTLFIQRITIIIGLSLSLSCLSVQDTVSYERVKYSRQLIRTKTGVDAALYSIVNTPDAISHTRSRFSNSEPRNYQERYGFLSEKKAPSYLWIKLNEECNFNGF